MPHALSNALVLPHVLRFNVPEAAVEYALLAPHVFPDVGTGEGAQAVAETFAERMANCRRRRGCSSD